MLINMILADYTSSNAFYKYENVRSSTPLMLIAVLRGQILAIKRQGNGPSLWKKIQGLVISKGNHPDF